MARTIWVISVGLVLLFAVEADGQDGRLQRVRDNVGAATPGEPNAKGASSASNDDAESLLGAFLGALLTAEDDDGRSVGGMMLAYSFFAPFYLPAVALGDSYKERLLFAPYPYAGAYRGYQVLPVELAETRYNETTDSLRRKVWAGRVLFENGNDLAGLNRAGIQLKLEHVSRWGLLTNWNFLHEKLGNGRCDDAWVSDTNITFRFAQNEIASMYTGLGFRMLTDRRQTDFGFNFTYGGDWFPVRPLVFSGVLNAGTLGSAGVIHLRGSAGLIWHGVEVYGGYDFLRIGGTNLDGPMVGMRFWF